MRQMNDLPDKELKIIIIKILTEVKRTMHEQNKNVKRDIKYKHHTEITELKNN